MAEIEEFLAQRQKQGLLRTLKPISSRKGAKIYFGKKQYIDLSSNDYLGLSTCPKFAREAAKAIKQFGTSACASRLMSGDLELHHVLERKIAHFKNKEAALIFNSGYQANIGIISSLYKKGDCIFSDRLNHASIIDGILLSGATLFRFQHNNIAHLESLLEKNRDKFKNSLIITETIFSMDGDKPPLKQLVSLKEKYNCRIMVDEAHATGIFGKNGSGVVEEENLSGQIDFIMGTFSKALAGFGAYLAADTKTTEYLINTCRSFIYSTALTPAIIVVNILSLDLIKKEPFRREKLLELAQYFRKLLQKKGFQIRGQSQIVPLVVGDNFKTKEFAHKLQKKGWWVLPIRPPTVPKNEARLRFSLSFNHNKQMLERLIDDISKIKI